MAEIESFEFRKPRSSRMWQVFTTISGERRMIGGVRRDGDRWLGEITYLGNPAQPGGEIVLHGATDREDAARVLLSAYEFAVLEYLVPQKVEIPTSNQAMRDLGREALLGVLRGLDNAEVVADLLIDRHTEVIVALNLATTEDRS